MLGECKPGLRKAEPQRFVALVARRLREPEAVLRLLAVILGQPHYAALATQYVKFQSPNIAHQEWFRTAMHPTNSGKIGS
jgi:hypothetical protein